MSNYVRITLDTIGPSGVSAEINGDETVVTSTAVTLTVECEDENTEGYQMKIWGVEGALTPEEAVWETYRTEKNVTLPAGDGLKTVSVIVRDDVWNESVVVTDTVTLNTKVPRVESLTVTNSKISFADGRNITTGVFWADEPVDAVKVMLVQDVNATHNNPSNCAILRTNGSYLSDEADGCVYSTESLEGTGNVDTVHGFEFVLYAADVAAASPGDGVKIIKAFVRSKANGNWSV